jgi:uncharacterized protein YkwD
MLNIINTYRKSNGKSNLYWSDSLAHISKKQVEIIFNEKVVSHSNTTGEIASSGVNLPFTKEEIDSFMVFMKEYFKVAYSEPNTDKEIETLFKYYIIYNFHKSPPHKKILLGNHKYIGFHVLLSKIGYKPNNVVVINGKEITLKNRIIIYEGNYYTVINFKI